jgi:hypothetical protein
MVARVIVQPEKCWNELVDRLVMGFVLFAYLAKVCWGREKMPDFLSAVEKLHVVVVSLAPPSLQFLVPVYN